MIRLYLAIEEEIKMTRITPIVGHWYKANEMQNIFEVVAFDEKGKWVEIQYFDGEIEEIDKDEWQHLHLNEIEQPKDWTGAFEMAKEDTEEFVEDVHHPITWENPIGTTDTYDEE